MQVQPLVLVPETYSLKRSASLWESWSDTTASRPPSASNSVNLEDNPWLEPNLVTVLARMKLRYWDLLRADLPLNPMHTIDCLCPCRPQTLSSHSFVKHRRTFTAPLVPSQNTPQSTPHPPRQPPQLITTPVYPNKQQLITSPCPLTNPPQISTNLPILSTSSRITTPMPNTPPTLLHPSHILLQIRTAFPHQLLRS